MTYDEILAAAMKLPDLQRECLGMLLLDSSRPPGIWSENDPGFFEELERRSRATDSGEAKTSSFEEVDCRIREEFNFPPKS